MTNGIGRRQFISVCGGATVAWPLAARAQQPAMRRIGVLIAISDDLEGKDRAIKFKQALSRLGWTEGDNIQFDTRFAGGDPEQIRGYAKELIGLHPDAIFAASTPAVSGG